MDYIFILLRAFESMYFIVGNDRLSPGRHGEHHKPPP